jgi:LPS-assembly lipoprotein
VLIGALAVLGGCGFQPVHGRRGRGGPALPSVTVAPIPEREGQLLRNALLERLRPAESPRHTMHVTLSMADQDLGILRDDRATLANLHLTARWRLLTPTGEGRDRLDLDRTARASVTYNISDNQYATELNRRDSLAGLVERIAADIETALVAHFAAGGVR